MVAKGSCVKVLVDGTDEWEKHEHEAELKDVKPLAEEVEGGHAVGTDKGKKRKQQPQSTSEIEHLSHQLQGENVALKRCKVELIEEDHAALHQHISAVGSSTVRHLLRHHEARQLGVWMWPHVLLQLHRGGCACERVLSGVSTAGMAS
jgi:hypothetical protein